VQFELAGQQRVAQILLERTSRLHLDVHFRFEEAQGAAPVALGAIEGQIRVPIGWHCRSRWSSCRRSFRYP
jgi:hypothetical protein